jgi:hypothetical protein
VSDETPAVETEEERPRSIFDLLETDTDSEENGRWFRDIFEDGSNIDLKLRRMTSKASMRARRNLDKQYKSKQNKRGEYDDETALVVIAKQIANGVIVDWNGVFDRDGSKMACTAANAEMLIAKLPALRDAVLVIASEMDNFRLEQREETEKNS